MDVIFPKEKTHVYFPLGKKVFALENPTAEADESLAEEKVRFAIKELMRR